jgi:hypothetical protein
MVFSFYLYKVKLFEEYVKKKEKGVQKEDSLRKSIPLKPSPQLQRRSAEML